MNGVVNEKNKCVQPQVAWKHYTSIALFLIYFHYNALIVSALLCTISALRQIVSWNIYLPRYITYIVFPAES